METPVGLKNHLTWDVHLTTFFVVYCSHPLPHCQTHASNTCWADLFSYVHDSEIFEISYFYVFLLAAAWWFGCHVLHFFRLGISIIPTPIVFQRPGGPRKYSDDLPKFMVPRMLHACYIELQEITEKWVSFLVNDGK